MFPHAYAYLQPILKGLRNNKSLSEITTKASLNNKSEQSLERRSADHIERIAFAIQATLDIFKVIDDIKPDIDNDIKIEFGEITKATRLKIKETIKKSYYTNDSSGSVNDSIADYPSDVDLLELDKVQIKSIKEAPKQTMKISLDAVKIAVKMYDELFYPQGLQLFKCELSAIEQAQNTKDNEKKILELPFNILYTNQLVAGGCIFRNAKRRNINAQQLLKNLVEKNILSSGKFLKTSAKHVRSWIRNFNFTNKNEFDKFKHTLFNDYGWTLESYLRRVKQNADYPTNLELVNPRGVEKLKQQKQSIKLVDEQIMRIMGQHSQKDEDAQEMDIDQSGDAENNGNGCFTIIKPRLTDPMNEKSNSKRLTAQRPGIYKDARYYLF
ncbi:unnamed protein product [Didymodactylos carnosus]|uniref:Uncharacterized protein n=1 Tax=Didymodactylos carnosus TaxID=1234261 RepID=A0A8S2DVB5_9BILA|nr:unnamed protein product [Didymodactylos carnosus]CAF3778958.1 unnamed protein product [Didymodactylos carnosus]